MANEEDIQPEFLPEGVLDFVESAQETIAHETGVPEDLIQFIGLTMKFKVEHRDITFEVMKVAE